MILIIYIPSTSSTAEIFNFKTVKTRNCKSAIFGKNDGSEIGQRIFKLCHRVKMLARFKIQFNLLQHFQDCRFSVCHCASQI